MDSMRIAKCVDLASKPSNFCPGCGYGIILKSLGQVIDEMEIGPRTVFGIDIGCNLLAWNYFNLDTVQTHHGRVTPLVSGYKRAQKDSMVFGIAGDGGLYSIGLQSLLHTAHRNEPVTIIGVNNTLYAMTGGQAGPTTTKGELTDTTPGGKFTYEKPFFGPELVREVAAPEAYIARATVTNIPDLKAKIKQAVQAQLAGNFSMVEILSYCPTNWKTNARETIDRIKDVEKVFPVGVISGK